MPTQVLLNPNGSGGDVYPFLAIGKELQNLGHHVAVMTNPLFQEFVGQAGLEFISVGSVEQLKSVGRDPALQNRSSAWQLALRWISASVAESIEYLSERRLTCPTMLVGSPLSFGMRMVSEKYSIPMATLVLSPYMLRSSYDSAKIPPLQLNRWIPRSFKDIQFWLADRLAIDPQLKPTLDSIRKQMGLLPTRRYLHRWCFSDHLTLGLFPDWFATRQPDWPKSYQSAGPVHWDPTLPHSAEPDSVVHWCRDQQVPPLVVLAGSAGPPSNQFYHVMIEASRRLERGLLVLEPDRALLPENLEGHTRHTRYLPLDTVLPWVDCVIHSGSIGATLRCATAGVRQLIFPRVNDQFDNAMRVVRMGIGEQISVRRICQMSPENLALSLDRFLKNREILNASQQLASRTAVQPEATVHPARLAAKLIHESFRLS